MHETSPKVAHRPVWYMTDAELVAEAEALNRAADMHALANPVTLARHLDPRYKLRPHLRAIGDALGAVRTNQGDCLMILTPPQVGKSVAVAVWLPFWWLIRNPRHRVIIASYGNSLAINRGKAIRRLVNDHGARYDLAMDRESRAANDWFLETGGGVKSVGVGAGITGTPGDLIVIDDPHKSRAEADSQIIRNKIYDWLSGDVNTRRQPGAPTVLIMTAWHVDDLRGRLLQEQGRVEEGGRWQVLHLPAFAGVNDQLGREPGEPLSHPKIPTRDKAALMAHWTEKKATSSVRDWHALYQGDPQPAEGALVSQAVLNSRRYLIAPARPVMHCVGVDPSGGGRDTAGIVAGFRGDDGRVYWTHDKSGVMATEKWSRVVCELAMELNAEKIVVESNFGGDQAALIIRTAWKALAEERRMRDIPPRIETVHARKGKKLRAEPVAQLLVEDRVRLVGMHHELESEWVSWQPTDTESPGRIDASVYLTLELLGDGPVNVATPTDLPQLPTMPGAPTAQGRMAVPGTGLPTAPGFGGRGGMFPGIRRPGY